MLNMSLHVFVTMFFMLKINPIPDFILLCRGDVMVEVGKAQYIYECRVI